MSILIDTLVEENKYCDVRSEYAGKWYIAQPILGTLQATLKVRLREAWKVFRGRAYTYHYHGQGYR